MPTTVRRAVPDDAELVRTMIGEIADHQDEGQYVTVTADRWRELLAGDTVTVLIAEYDGEPAGYVSAVRRLHLWTGGDVLGLDDLYVREAFRGQRVGELLMLELARQVAAPHKLTITWGMRESNEGAQRFYARLGASLKTKVLAAWPYEAYSKDL
ncbi:GNAT family N-acetyltransferase [Kribbella italica]|uniref:Ribosomal protein S18 acetylase RimI-like enzyme n=1 Tax=Kribbella italica TaxID=1540520 RepID=A0A7W9MZ45_9ACTN|nr:GNAT family N-acetyltransferase [Kribbella italica]MBB5841022.1 ribosomal protein S18 acetylase RimI-like enzyme [Kribbella italica]